MSKLNVISVLAVLVACALAIVPPPHPKCNSKLGEALKGPGRVCELICPAGKLQRPVQKCFELKRQGCICCSKLAYCRNTKTRKCEKLSRRD